MPEAPVSWWFTARFVTTGKHRGRVGWRLVRCDYRRPTRSTSSTDRYVGGGYAASLGEALAIATDKAGGPLTPNA